MKDDSRMRDTRMMNAVAGMGGRNVLSSEVDLRLGITSNVARAPGWLHALVRRMGRRTAVPTDGGESLLARTAKWTPSWLLDRSGK